MIESILNFFGFNWTMRRLGRESAEDAMMLKASIGLFERPKVFDKLPIYTQVRLHKQLLKDIKTLKKNHLIDGEKELVNLLSSEIVSQIWQQTIRFVLAKAQNDSGYVTTYKTTEKFVEILKTLDVTKYNIIISPEVATHLMNRKEFRPPILTAPTFYIQNYGFLCNIRVLVDPYLPVSQILVMPKDLVDFNVKAELSSDVLGDIKLNPSLSKPEKGIKFTGDLYINTYTGFVVSEIKDIKIQEFKTK